MRSGILGVALLVMAPACQKTEQTDAPSPAGEGASLYARRTTDGEIAVNNLNAQIVGVTKSAKANPRYLPFQSSRVYRLMTRADFLGTYSDFDDALEAAEAAVRAQGNDPEAWLLRAYVYSALHRFEPALADVQRAEKLSGKASAIALRRETIWLAQGKHYQKVRAARTARAEAMPSYASYTSLAAAHTALGDWDQADAAYLKALDLYHDTSAFTVAWVFFQRGVLWAEHAGQPEKGRAYYQEALRRLPRYVRATVHLAEIEAKSGERQAAIARLRALLERGIEDPEPEGLLGKLLQGKPGGRECIERASAKYDALLEKYPLAFSDHASEFFGGPGADPERALELARANFDNRKTDRALLLTLVAAQRAKDTQALCAFAAQATDPVMVLLKSRLQTVRAACTNSPSIK